MRRMYSMAKLLELKKPQMVADAAEKRRGLHIVLEILVFFAVFVVCSIAEMIVMTPMELVLMFTNSDYMNAAVSGDMAGIVAATNAVMQSNAMTIIMLFPMWGLSWLCCCSVS